MNFNSATAVEPWRTEGRVPDPEKRQARDFNSATAVEPWRTPGWAFRFVPPGSNALQFGHGGGAVENSEEN